MKAAATRSDFRFLDSTPGVAAAASGSVEGETAIGPAVVGAGRAPVRKRAWISLTDPLRLGSRCKQPFTIPRKGSGTVSGRSRSFGDAASAIVTFCVKKATKVTPTDQMSLAGETIPAAVSGAS